MTPVSILQKPGRLSDDEFDTITLHPVQGYEILQRYSLECLTPNVMNAVLLHHERLDGKGYPYSRTCHIPKIAKIISVIDAFDSITSHRP
jgi:HD-GYP domain-containing protein (c-di-GMP phosphodiesterase class II)